MEKIMRPVWAEIDLDILANNMKNIKNFLYIEEIRSLYDDSYKSL